MCLSLLAKASAFCTSFLFSLTLASASFLAAFIATSSLLMASICCTKSTRPKYCIIMLLCYMYCVIILMSCSNLHIVGAPATAEAYVSK